MLADWGAATCFNPRDVMTGTFVTIPYAAPEMLGRFVGLYQLLVKQLIISYPSDVCGLSFAVLYGRRHRRLVYGRRTARIGLRPRTVGVSRRIAIASIHGKVKVV